MEPEGSLLVHKSPPLVPKLSQNNPVHTTSSCFSKIQLVLVDLPCRKSLHSVCRISCPVFFPYVVLKNLSKAEALCNTS
jgi:hypothetical protein